MFRVNEGSWVTPRLTLCFHDCPLSLLRHGLEQQQDLEVRLPIFIMETRNRDTQATEKHFWKEFSIISSYGVEHYHKLLQYKAFIKQLGRVVDRGLITFINFNVCCKSENIDWVLLFKMYWNQGSRCLKSYVAKDSFYHPHGLYFLGNIPSTTSCSARGYLFFKLLARTPIHYSSLCEGANVSSTACFRNQIYCNVQCCCEKLEDLPLPYFATCPLQLNVHSSCQSSKNVALP